MIHVPYKKYIAESEIIKIHARERIFIMYSTIKLRILRYYCKELAILI